MCYNNYKGDDEMKQLCISLTDDNELKVSANDQLTVGDMVDLSLSAILAMCNSIVHDAPTDKQQEVKEYLFNMFNISASALLAQFAPEIDLRPDITEEAILIKELELANDRLQVSDM